MGYIANVDGKLEVLTVGDRVIPLFVPSSQSSVYVTNPGIHYFDYVAHELEVSVVEGGRRRAACMRLLQHLLGFGEVRRIVYANNYILPGRLPKIALAYRSAWV